MKRNVSQAGSLSAIIIAVLFIALMATLGVVFYQNFIQEKPKATPQQTAHEPTGDTMKTARVAFGNDIYALDYPDNWKETKTPTKTDAAVKGTELVLTSPSGKVAVKFVVDQATIDTTCDKADGRKISYYNVAGDANVKLTGIPLSMVETLYDHTGGGYDYLVGLTQEGGATHASVNNTHCNITLVGLASTYHAATNAKPMQPLILAQVIFPELPVKDEKPAAPDMQTIKELIATDEYKLALKALESARKE